MAEQDIHIVRKSALVHTHGGRVLSTRSKGKTTYYLPGGKPEGSETPLDTLLREIREELAINLDPATCYYLGRFTAPCDGKPAGWEIVMECFDSPLPEEPKASAEIDEIIWLSYEDRSRVSPVDQKIFDWLHSCGKLA